MIIRLILILGVVVGFGGAAIVGGWWVTGLIVTAFICNYVLSILQAKEKP